MKKRMFSLWMAILLVLSAMGSFSVFAESVTHDVTPGIQTSIFAPNDYYDASVERVYADDVVDMRASGQYITYKVNVTEAAKYDISVKLTMCTSPNYKFNVYVDDELKIEGLQIGSDAAGTYVLGTLDLAVGEREIKIEQASAYAVYLKYVYLDVYNVLKDEVTVLGVGKRTSTTGTYYTDNSTAGDYISTEGLVELTSAKTITYDVFAAENATYSLSIYLGNTAGTVARCNVSVGQEQVLTGIATNAMTKRKHATMSELGKIELSKGYNTITIKTTEYGGYFYAVYLDKVTAEETNPLNADVNDFGVRAATSYEVVKEYLSDNSTAGDYISTEGLLEVSASKGEMIYDVYAPQEGTYKLSVYLGNSADTTAQFKVTMDNKEIVSGVKTNKMTKFKHATKSTVAAFKLTEGLHTIKLNVTATGGWFYGICLEKATGISVSLSAVTRLSAKGDVVFGSDYVAGDTVATQGIINTDGSLYAESKGKMFYIVDAEEAGEYKISLEAGVTTATGVVSISTDDETESNVFKPLVASVSYGAKAKVGSVSLKEGVQIICIETGENFVGYIYGVVIERNAYVLSDEDKTEISACDFDSKSTGDNYDVYINDSSTEGIIVTGLVAYQNGYSYSYKVHSENGGSYRMSVIAGGDAIKGTVTDGNGNVLIAEKNLTTSTSGLKNAQENVAGIITLPKGDSEITITAADASTYVYSFSFEKLSPVVEVFEGEIEDEMYAYEVVAGTMSAKIALNGYLNGKSALVVFAIYETDANGVVKLYKAYAETVSTVTAETVVRGSINDIIKDNTKTYSVNVYMWDLATLYGEEVNYI